MVIILQIWRVEWFSAIRPLNVHWRILPGMSAREHSEGALLAPARWMA